MRPTSPPLRCGFLVAARAAPCRAAHARSSLFTGAAPGASTLPSKPCAEWPDAPVCGAQEAPLHNWRSRRRRQQQQGSAAERVCARVHHAHG